LDEYNYQATVGTKREVANLVKSDSYREAMINKGSSVNKWNWQVQDK